MPYSPRNFANSYRKSLTRYVEAGEESQLAEAYNLGRAACVNGSTILELVEVHRSAVATLALADGTRDAAAVDATFTFLAEALSTFEMAQRGYWEAQESSRRERAIALKLQNDLMPAAAPQVEGLDVAVRYLSGEVGTHAGGDWYDVFEVPEDAVGLVVGDVTGHGVGAAAMMGQLRIAVLAYALGGKAPATVVEEVDLLLHRLAGGDIATLVYVLADLAHDRLVMTSAGHPPPVLVPAGGKARLWTEGRGRLVGVSPPARGRSQAVAAFPVGSQLLLYTDGLVEATERTGQDGFARLLEIAQGFEGSAAALCDHVLAQLAPDGGRDDICILAATRLG
jgi:serine phosphatase RsbU (regulator of sigma subunit)